MSIIIQQKVLFEMLQKAYPLIPLKSSLPVLSHFKICVHGLILEIVATDLDHSIKIMSQVEGSGEFDIAVNARKVFDIVRELPDEKVTITVEENVFLLKNESGFECKIAGTDTQTYPGFPELTTTKEIDISICVLADMVKKSSFAVAKDESRPCLAGILWEIEPDKATMVATDGHRLGSSNRAGDFLVDEKVSVIVSPKSISHLVKIIESPDAQKQIHVSIAEKYIAFTSESLVMCTKLIDGPYPDYDKVIPSNNPKIAIIDKTAFSNAVRRVSVLSNQKTHLIKCVFAKENMDIIVQNRDIGGEAQERIPISYTGPEHTIGFNAQYVSEIIAIIACPKIKIEMNTQISACLILPYYEDEKDITSNDLFLVMPLRIMDEG